jgi:hypothetical protein
VREEFLNRTLEDACREAFQTELPELTCQNHKILVVAARLDASAERIINYLSERYGVEINAAFFTYSKLSGGNEVLARTMLVADDLRPPGARPGRKQPPPTTDALLAMADERKALPLVEVCRKAGEVWKENRGAAYGGSFTYWATNASGNSRSGFGIIPGAKYAPPPGQLDVWIPVKNLSEISGIAEDAIRKALTDQHPVRETWAIECWLRLKEIEQAIALVAQLKAWRLQADDSTHA